MPDQSPLTDLTDLERERLLSLKIDEFLLGDHADRKSPWRVESRSDFRAVLVRDRRVNHKLHFALTFVTMGLWALVWMVLAAHADEPRRKVIEV